MRDCATDSLGKLKKVHLNVEHKFLQIGLEICMKTPEAAESVKRRQGCEEADVIDADWPATRRQFFAYSQSLCGKEAKSKRINLQDGISA